MSSEWQYWHSYKIPKQIRSLKFHYNTPLNHLTISYTFLSNNIMSDSISLPLPFAPIISNVSDLTNKFTPSFITFKLPVEVKKAREIIILKVFWFSFQANGKYTIRFEVDQDIVNKNSESESDNNNNDVAYEPPSVKTEQTVCVFMIYFF